MFFAESAKNGKNIGEILVGLCGSSVDYDKIATKISHSFAPLPPGREVFVGAIWGWDF